MGTSSLITNAGLLAFPWIDGAEITPPLSHEMRQMPDDVFEFLLRWELGSKSAAEQSALSVLSELRSSAVGTLMKTITGRYMSTAPYRGRWMPNVGGVHSLVNWKYLRYKLTGYIGQTLFYLPRPDSFGKAYSGHTDQATYGAKITAEGSSLTVDYVSSVDSGTAVTAGHVKISTTPIQHPDSGLYVTTCKLGTALASTGIIYSDYIPFFSLYVTDPQLQPFERVAREDQSVLFVESVELAAA